MTKADKHDVLRGYIADQRAVIQHIFEAVERHTKDDSVQESSAARDVLVRLRDVLKRQHEALSTHIEEKFEGDGATGKIKDAVTTVSGYLTGLYGKVRGEPVSRMLRDDTTAIHFACTCYSMLYTTAAALGNKETESLASAHLNELTPFVIELTDVLPQAVVTELEQDTASIDKNAVKAALIEVNRAWRGEHVHDRVM